MTLPLTPLFTILQSSVVVADPHVLSDIRDRRSIIDSIYDALIRRNSNGEFIPWLAAEWLVDSRAQLWRFRLRDNILFHSGEPLTAHDAADSLRRAISPEMPGELGTQGVLRGYLAGASIAATDDRWLTIDTPQPFADLLDLLVDIPVVQSAALPYALVGSGPYQLVDQQPGKIVMQAFAQHWAGVPPVATLVWQAEADAQQRLNMLQQGEADLVVDPPRSLVNNAEGIHLLSQQSHLCIIFLFNLSAGATQDVRVRQALNYAINLESIINDPAIAAGQAQPLAGPLTARHPGAPRDLSPYAFDPAQARRLLAEAGYAEGLTLDLSLPARFPDESIPLAERIANQLQAVGVTVNLTVYQDRPAYAQRIRDKQFTDLCCFDSSPASAWRVYTEKLDSRRQGPWWQGYHSDQLNALLDHITTTTDADSRAPLLAQAFTLIHQDAPWLFLYAPDNLWALGPQAVGWQPGFEGRVRIINTADSR